MNHCSILLVGEAWGTALEESEIETLNLRVSVPLTQTW